VPDEDLLAYTFELCSSFTSPFSFLFFYDNVVISGKWPKALLSLKMLLQFCLTGKAKDTYHMG
jgi:hypothetical protein